MDDASYEEEEFNEDELEEGEVEEEETHPEDQPSSSVPDGHLLFLTDHIEKTTYDHSIGPVEQEEENEESRLRKRPKVYDNMDHDSHSL